MSDIIFHIGYPKTGTTYLQKRVFPQVGALGKDSVVEDALHSYREMKYLINTQPASVWKTRYGQDLADEICRQAYCDPILFSSEAFLFPPFFLPSVPTFEPERWRFRPTEHLEAFQTNAWNGRVRALVTVRNQADWLASLYAERSGAFPASQADFKKQINDILRGDDEDSVGFLDYGTLVDELSRTLGSDNVKVLFYEELGQQGFLEELCGFTGLHFNLDAADQRDNVRREASSWRLSPRKVAIYAIDYDRRRKVKKIVRPIVNPVWQRVSKQADRKIELSSHLRQNIFEKCRSYNNRLASLTGKDLTALGYFG